MVKAIWDEREGHTSDPRHTVRLSQRASKSEHAVAAQRETYKRRDTMYCQRFETQGIEREEWQGNAVDIFTKGECVPVRVKDVCLKKVDRVSESAVITPPQNPSHQIRVSRIPCGITQVKYPWPGHHDG